MLTVWKRVFSNWRLTALALVVAGAVISFAVWVSNIGLILSVFSSPVSFGAKLSLLTSLYGSLATNFSFVSAIATVLIALLVGINSSLLVYYIRSRKMSGKNTVGHSAGVLGVVSGVFGVGCAACGSVILAGLASSFGGLALLALLPLHGAEFSLLGVALLVYSIAELSKRIADPLVCPVS